MLIYTGTVNIAAIATTVTLIFVVLLITITSLCLLLGLTKLNQKNKKSQYNVKFSVKDEAGSLARALKVFKVALNYTL